MVNPHQGLILGLSAGNKNHRCSAMSTASSPYPWVQPTDSINCGWKFWSAVGWTCRCREMTAYLLEKIDI